MTPDKWRSPPEPIVGPPRPAIEALVRVTKSRAAVYVRIGDYVRVYECPADSALRFEYECEAEELAKRIRESIEKTLVEFDADAHSVQLSRQEAIR